MVICGGESLEIDSIIVCSKSYDGLAAAIVGLVHPNYADVLATDA